MPTYLYECSACNSTFEAEQRIIEDPLDTCACGSKGTVKRLIQPIAVMFKGSGFHINDYSTRPAATSDATPAPAAAPDPAPAPPSTDPAPSADAT